MPQSQHSCATPQYKPSLERDPSLNTIMDQISLKYYNRGPPPPRMGSPGAPSNLFNMMVSVYVVLGE